MHLIFVYGTLKRGGSNHGFLAGQTFVGEARTVPGFRLFEVGGYPGMVEYREDPDGVAGEVWSVDAACLQRLDELEDVPGGLYRRVTVALLPPFADQTVDAYLYCRDIAGRAEVGSVWTE